MYRILVETKDHEGTIRYQNPAIFEDYVVSFSTVQEAATALVESFGKGMVVNENGGMEMMV